MSKIIDLRQKRAALIGQMGAITEKVAKEGRGFTAEEQEQWEKMFAEEKSLRATIEALEATEGLQRSASDRQEQRREPEQQAAPTYDEAFRQWLQRGTEDMPGEMRTILRAGFQGDAARDLSVGSNVGGGYTVPTGFRAQLIDAMKFFGGMRVARTTQFTTASGQQLQMPTDNDTANVGAIIGENTPDTTQDTAFNQVTFTAYKYTSKIVKVSLELVNDSAFDIGAFLAQKLGQRIGRITNTHFTVGTNASQPQGVITGATAGPTAASPTAIAYADLVELKFSVDVAYRNNAEWMLHDQVWKLVLKLVDSAGRPIIRGVDIGVSENMPDTLLGQPVRINNDMDSAPAATKKTVLYGDFSNYWIRDVQDIFLVRFNERFMDAYQVGFAALYRGDGRIVDAGTHPLKYLLH